MRRRLFNPSFYYTPTNLLLSTQKRYAFWPSIDRGILNYDLLQWLDCALAALQTLSAADFTQAADAVPRPYADYPSWTEDQYELDDQLVPPENEELDTLPGESGEAAPVNIKKDEWPQCYIRLFDDDVRVTRSRSRQCC